jgi:rhodanese-related sulfurtransferase
MKHLKPAEAATFLHENPSAVFIDCRSEMEYYFVGIPLAPTTSHGTTDRTGRSIPHFVGQVKKVASMNRPVRAHLSQRPSLARRPASPLEKAGFSEVYNIVDGFEGPLDDNQSPGRTVGVAEGRAAVGAEL